MAENKCHYY